ncbi:MAG: TetR/AcrR family transcriptional regulator [Eubacterium sp.]|nr:TetR/AcrR family transcriptional regulator [Eubacterium sp.]
MQKFSISNFTKRNKFTRMCIGEAVIALMKEKIFDKITILDITRKAGVSRMTFYKYYHSKEQVVESYLQEIISGYVEKFGDNFSDDFPNFDNTLAALNYFDEYADFFLEIAHAGLYNLLINAVNLYMEETIVPRYQVSPYKIYYYAGALLNIFIKWEESGKNIDAETIAKTIASIKLN